SGGGSDAGSRSQHRASHSDRGSAVGEYHDEFHFRGDHRATDKGVAPEWPQLRSIDHAQRRRFQRHFQYARQRRLEHVLGGGEAAGNKRVILHGSGRGGGEGDGEVHYAGGGEPAFAG